MRFARGTSTCSACAPCSEPSVAPWPNTRASSHLWYSPRMQKKHDPQAVWKQPSTRSPTSTFVTASPAAITVADELVADHEAGLDLHAAVVDVEVRAADAGRLDLHDRVVGREQLGLGPLFDPHLAGRLEGDGAACAPTAAVRPGARAPR